MRQLIGLYYSPWTERARWALTHHQLPFKYSEHLVFFGEPELRVKLRRPRGGLTVPVLIDTDVKPAARLMDSWDIAVHADSIGAGAKLFPEGMLEKIKRFNDLSEEGSAAGRALVAAKVASDPEALREALPPFVPGPLRGASVFLARFGVNYMRRAFDLNFERVAEYESRLRDVLQRLRQALKESGGDYLLPGGFTYADLTSATLIQMIQPRSDKPRLQPATRRAWTQAKLASEFPDLIEWRDRIYARHRPASGKA